MTAPTIHTSAAGMYRTTDGLGLWPYRGKVAAVGIGHSPTMRRWDGDPQTSIGAWCILAVRKAIADAAAYVFTTAERARDLKQPPVYVLGHGGGGTVRGDSYSPIAPRSSVETEWKLRKLSDLPAEILDN